MKTRRWLAIAVVATVGAVAAAPLAAQDKSWKGQSVLPNRPAKDITFVDNSDGKQVNVPFSGRWPITVREDREGWLRIHDGHREGWADKSQFVLVRDAPAYFHRRVQADPKDTWALFLRGAGWLAKGEPDNAIKDFDECIRLDPTGAAAFNSRGNAWRAKKEYDKAIQDYDEALRLDPQSAPAFISRGSAWHDKKEYDKAIQDYDEALRLDPQDAPAFINRGAAWHDKKDYDRAIQDYDEAIRLDPKDAFAFMNRGNAWDAKKEYDKAIQDYDEVLRLDPKRGDVAILGHFAARRAGDAPAATRFLKDAARNLAGEWPYPVVQFLRGETDEAALLKLATDDDKKTEARCYLGLDHLLKGRKDEALAHFRWVKEHGTVTFIEYTIAVAELERLEPAEKE